ncbi:hypothetical protein D770_22085 [Flammeovirgaceae bacterium 311]|nr:hypothetical protein D770_22085 [Flammeovirgaceae bacterium 311]
MIQKTIAVFLMVLMATGICQAQFIDSFEDNKLEGWLFFPGDGNASIDFVPKQGYATMVVDASKDRHNAYWTIIKRNVAPFLKLEKLKDPAFELRVEARVRIPRAPRRLNIMVNTQKTTDFHHDLMEFDIPDTSWHVISMTTRNLDAVPGDSLFVQLGVTDFGLGQYEVDVDYFKADIVNTKKADPDKGLRVPYHPPIPDLNTFSNHLNVTHDALINLDFPEVNFNDWQVKEKGGNARILTVNGNQWAVLRWDLKQFKNQKAQGAAVLELTTQSVSKGGNYIEAYGQDYGMEFGKIRVIEILGGDPDWEQGKVTFNSLMQGKPYEEVFNEQMMYDTEMAEQNGDKTYITISEPVLQRLLDGTTKGLLIRPLGAIDASFYASENGKGMDGPKIHFNTKK